MTGLKNFGYLPMTLGSSNLKRKKPRTVAEERFAFPRQPEVEVSRQVGRQLGTNETRSSQMDENSKKYYDLVGCCSRRETSADVNGVAFTRRTTGYPIDDDFHERNPPNIPGLLTWKLTWWETFRVDGSFSLTPLNGRFPLIEFNRKIRREKKWKSKSFALWLMAKELRDGVLARGRKVTL
ncbi:hypothetical protein RUM43_008067 [Polyplax serrata]|uniref:Uncharacterized protein n=1 Tax=Polyplax serrata TaxID=468196 RepID=A0AAN8PNJ9_POLSC